MALREVHVRRALIRRSPKQTFGFVKLLRALKASGQLFSLFLSQPIRGHLLWVPKPNRVRQGILQSPLSLSCLGPNPIRDLDWSPTSDDITNRVGVLGTNQGPLPQGRCLGKGFLGLSLFAGPRVP